MHLKLKPEYPDKLILMPDKIINKLNEVGETELKIILLVISYLSKAPLGTASEEELFAYLEECGFESNVVTPAIAFWRGAGLIEAFKENKKREKTHSPSVKLQVEKKQDENESKEKLKTLADNLKQDDEPPFYSSAQLSEAAENIPEFKALCEFAQERLGKVFNTSELACLYSFFDYLKLPADVIMLSIEDCTSNNKGSLRYIKKQLLTFADNEIDNYEKAEAYLAGIRKIKSFEGKIRTLCGIGERALLPKEKEAVNNWAKEWGLDFGLIEYAYEKTVSGIGKPSINYMNKILEKWHEAGIKTRSEAERETGGKSEKADKSYDLDDFFEAAVSKTRKNLIS